MKFKITIFYLLFLAQGWLSAQNVQVTISGKIVNQETAEPMPYVNVVLKSAKDSVFVIGTVSNEEGFFTLSNVSSGDYFIQISFVGFQKYFQNFYVGNSSDFLALGTLTLKPSTNELGEVIVAVEQDEVNGKMDKMTYEVDDNISQQGGSVLQVMQNLPGVTIEDGKVVLRGNPNVIILIDGKQSALTGFGNQSGLENIPASSIERIDMMRTEVRA